PAAGSAKVRVIHAAPAAGAFDVYITDPTADIATASPSLTDITFNSASAYVELPSGNYELRITPSGTKTVSIDTPLTLGDGDIRTAIATEAVGGGPPLSAVVLADEN